MAIIAYVVSFEIIRTRITNIGPIRTGFGFRRLGLLRRNQWWIVTEAQSLWYELTEQWASVSSAADRCQQTTTSSGARRQEALRAEFQSKKSVQCGGVLIVVK